MTMVKSETVVRTELASRYLQQLCKHWSHKLAVEFTPEHGEIKFGEDRVCRLTAGPSGLRLSLEMPDEDVLTRMQNVVFEHLQRFAFREALAEPHWTRL